MGTGSANLKPGGDIVLSTPLCGHMAHYFLLIFNLNNYEKAIQNTNQSSVYNFFN